MFSGLLPAGETVEPAILASVTAQAHEASRSLAASGYLRTQFTSSLVDRFINGVTVEVNEAFPQLSRVSLVPEVLRTVEVLKHFTYEATIMSPRLKVSEHRGYEIVQTIFNELARDGGYLLLPDDFRELHQRCQEIGAKHRVICDFIAGMTDRYAIEFYSRLKSENPQSIFKPL